MASPAAQVDYLAVGRTDARLSMPFPGDDDNRESLHRFDWKPKVAFSQEWISTRVTNCKFGEESETEVPKFIDDIHKLYAHIGLSGIIGVQDTSKTHSYPYLVDTGCVEGSNTNCVPSQEALLSELRFDYSSEDLDEGGSLIHHPFVHWVNGAGFRVLEKFVYECGDVQTDSIDFRYIQAFEALHGSAGKRHTYQAAIYDTREEMIRASLQKQELFVSIPLWFTHYLGLCKHMSQMILTKVRFRITLAKKESLIVCSDKHTTPYISKADNSTWTTNIADTGPHDRVAYREIEDGDIALNMLYQGFYMEEAEKERITEMIAASSLENPDEVVFTWLQTNDIQTKGISQLTHKLEGTHPIFEVLLIAQLKANRESNNWFNYTRVGPESGTARNNDDTRNHEVRLAQNDLDIITEIGVDVNTSSRFRPMISQVWRNVCPQVYHTNIPDKYSGHYIYTVSWAAFPEDIKMYSGSLNLTRITSCVFNIKLHESVVSETVYLNFYIRSWGLFAYYSNVGGPFFGG